MVTPKRPIQGVSALFKRLTEVAWSAASAVALVLAVVIARQHSKNFHEIAALVTVASFTAPIAAGGLDQALFRLNSSSEGRPRRVSSTAVLFTCLAVTAGHFAVLFSFAGWELLRALTPLILLQGVTAIAAATTRAQKKFYESVMWVGLWRFILLVYIMLEAFASTGLAVSMLWGASICGMAIALRTVAGSASLIKTPFDTEWVSWSFRYLMAAAIFSLLSVLDRALVWIVAPTQFSDYVVFATVLLYPFTFLGAALSPIYTHQIHIGRSERLILKELILWLAASGGLYLFLNVIVTFDSWGFLRLPAAVPLSVVWLGMLLALIRVAYSFASARYTCVATKKALLGANLLTITSMALAAILALFLAGIAHALLLTFAVWFVRTLHGYSFGRRCIREA